MLNVVKEWKVFLMVAFFGCVGAAIAFGVKAAGPIELVSEWNHPITQTLFQIGVGAFASTIFIFLLSNTDRSDPFRLLCLAMMSGFLWNPVLETIKKYNIVAEQSKSSGKQVELSADAAKEALKADSGTATFDLNAFLKDYAAARPLLLPDQASKADKALDDILKSTPKVTLDRIPDSTFEGLGSLKGTIPDSSSLWDNSIAVPRMQLP